MTLYECINISSCQEIGYWSGTLPYFNDIQKTYLRTMAHVHIRTIHTVTDNLNNNRTKKSTPTIQCFSNLLKGSRNIHRLPPFQF